MFYEYIEKIKSAIENNLGADVDLLLIGEEPCSGLKRIPNKLSRGKYSRQLNIAKQKKFFEEHQNDEYDYIFVLVGRGIDSESFEMFCNKHQNSKKVLYLWDDVKRVEDFNDIKHLFDNIISFDKEDCFMYGFEFLPLFYCNDYLYSNDEKNNDFSMIGQLHSDRAKLIRNFLDLFPRETYSWNIVLKTTKDGKKQYGKLLEGVHLNYDNISIKDSAQVLRKSRITIDIPHESQNGLSIRTLEALASKTKLITTNKNIVGYDIYNPENIYIIDRKNINVDQSFIDSEFVDYSKDMIQKYSIDSWVRTILK